MYAAGRRGSETVGAAILSAVSCGVCIAAPTSFFFKKKEPLQGAAYCDCECADGVE